jgi:hypothetical protein
MKIPPGDHLQDLLEQLHKNADLLIQERCDGILIAANEVVTGAIKLADSGKLEVSGPLVKRKLRQLKKAFKAIVEDELDYDGEEDEEEAPRKAKATGAKEE